MAPCSRTGRGSAAEPLDSRRYGKAGSPGWASKPAWATTTKHAMRSAPLSRALKNATRRQMAPGESRYSRTPGVYAHMTKRLCKDTVLPTAFCGCGGCGGVADQLEAAGLGNQRALIHFLGSGVDRPVSISQDSASSRSGSCSQRDVPPAQSYICAPPNFQLDR